MINGGHPAQIFTGVSFDMCDLVVEFSPGAGHRRDDGVRFARVFILAFFNRARDRRANLDIGLLDWYQLCCGRNRSEAAGLIGASFAGSRRTTLSAKERSPPGRLTSTRILAMQINESLRKNPFHPRSLQVFRWKPSILQHMILDPIKSATHVSV